MFKRSGGWNTEKTGSVGEKRQESVPSDLCKSGSNEQDTEWLAYSSAPNICHTE